MTIMKEALISVEQQAQVYQPTELIFSEQADVDEFAASTVLELVSTKPDAVIVTLTGNTPIGMYRKIAEEADFGRRVDFSKATFFNLDEYWKIGRGDKASFRRFMHEHFYAKVNVPAGNRNIPDGQYIDPINEALVYQKRFDIFRKKGIDLAILGIGKNGHIGFNEPGSPFDSVTDVVTLTQETRQANAQDFKRYPDEPIEDALERVPLAAITLGLGEKGIRAANEILLLAKGESKASILEQAFRQVPTTDVPASVLQYHPNVTLALDSAAGAGLAKRYTQGVVPHQ